MSCLPHLHYCRAESTANAGNANRHAQPLSCPRPVVPAFDLHLFDISLSIKMLPITCCTVTFAHGIMLCGFLFQGHVRCAAYRLFHSRHWGDDKVTRAHNRMIAAPIIATFDPAAIIAGTPRIVLDWCTDATVAMCT